MAYDYGPDVTYRMVPTGRDSERTVLRIRDDCPTCHASWFEPGSVRLGHQVGLEYYCWTCGTFHRGVEIDERGRRVPGRFETHESGPGTPA